MDASGGISNNISTSYIALRYPRRDSNGMTFVISKRAIDFARIGFLKSVFENQIEIKNQL